MPHEEDGVLGSVKRRKFFVDLFGLEVIVGYDFNIVSAKVSSCGHRFRVIKIKGSGGGGTR